MKIITLEIKGKLNGKILLLHFFFDGYTNIKYVTMTFISGFNKSALYLQEHVMYEHYASDYKSVGPVHNASDYYESSGPE